MRKGTSFTLIELIVVIAIIAILAAIVAPNAFKAIEKARISGLEGDYRNIKTGAMSYYSDTSTWPNGTSCQGGTANVCGLVTNDTAASWAGPYMEKWPQHNAWGGVYLWRNDMAGTFTGGITTISERYIVANNVANQSAQKLDTNLDDGANTTGIIRFSGIPATMNLEVSDDNS
jgi:general secretion pathway protein G